MKKDEDNGKGTTSKKEGKNKLAYLAEGARKKEWRELKRSGGVDPNEI
jgi:hypothetical protein